MVTDQIDTFTETGIGSRRARELEADIVVTATGLQLVTLGEMEFVVDGEPVDFSRDLTYKGFAYSDVPNLASSFGYINASWTLRADLTCEYVCRLLNHMDADRHRPVHAAAARVATATCPRAPGSRFLPRLHAACDAPVPKQGDREPWINPQNYTARQEDVPQGAAWTTV